MRHSHLSAICYARLGLSIASDLGTFLEFHVWIWNDTSQCILVWFVPLGCNDVPTGQFLVIRYWLQDSYDYICSGRIVTIEFPIPLRSNTIITIIVNDLLLTGTCRCVLIRAWRTDALFCDKLRLVKGNFERWWSRFEPRLDHEGHTVKLRWLEHWWLVYHGCFELVLKSLGKNYLAAELG